MKIMSSYGIEIKNMNKIFYPTIAVYNKAVSFCIYMFPFVLLFCVIFYMFYSFINITMQIITDII